MAIHSDKAIKQLHDEIYETCIFLTRHLFPDVSKPLICKMMHFFFMTQHL